VGDADDKPSTTVSPGGSGGGGAASGGTTDPQNWAPVVACEPTLPVKVTRLSDRHLAHALRDLLGLAAPPPLSTSSSSSEQFLPNKAAAVDGAVATKLRDLAERLALEVTTPGHAYASCGTDEPTCANAFIRDFGARAFRRPLQEAEVTELTSVYGVGRSSYGQHVGGIRLVIEGLLQPPSFLYQTELGSGTAQPRLTQPELAAKLSFFLRDGLPDSALRDAASAGQLETQQQVLQHVDRLLGTDEVKWNVSKMFVRLFDLERLQLTNKAKTVTEFSPELVDSMAEETRLFIDATLWQRGAKLSELLASRETFVDARLAAIYGVPAPAASGFSPVTLNAAQRAGILTHPSVMTHANFDPFGVATKLPTLRCPTRGRTPLYTPTLARTKSTIGCLRISCRGAEPIRTWRS